jgi:hypothetical protein
MSKTPSEIVEENIRRRHRENEEESRLIREGKLPDLVDDERVCTKCGLSHHPHKCPACD